MRDRLAELVGAQVGRFPRGDRADRARLRKPRLRRVILQVPIRRIDRLPDAVEVRLAVCGFRWLKRRLCGRPRGHQDDAAGEDSCAGSNHDSPKPASV